MKANTALRVASISKPVTAIAVLRLCQEGRLSLDTTVFGASGRCQCVYRGESQYAVMLLAVSCTVADC